jgi:hypothetical protein
MDEEPQWAITLYVPDRLLPALNGQALGLRAILEGAPELEFIVPRWWEGSHTVRLGVLKPAPAPRSQPSCSEEAHCPASSLQGLSAPLHAEPECLNREHHG